MVLLNSPRLTQCNRFASFSSSAEASSLSAITVMSIPRLRAPSTTRNGKHPFPAMSPQPVVLAFASGIKSVRSLLHDAALGAFDKPDQFLHVGGIAQRFPHFGQRLRGIQLRAQEKTIGPLQGLQTLRRKSFALQPNGIDAKAFRLAFGDDFGKRRHILGNHRRSPDVGVAADPAKLMHGTKRANRREILHRDVSREGCAVDKQGVAADRAIVPDVRIRQKKIAVAQGSFAAAFLRAAADGDVFAENVAVSRHHLGALASKRIILRVAADRAERIESIVSTELRRSPHHRVRVHHAAVAQFYVFTNHRVRADFYTLTKLCARRHHCLRMNFAPPHFARSSDLPGGSRSIILHITVPSAANSPFTVALPSNLQKSPRQLRTLTSMRSCAPGTTGRRNRAPSTA